LHFTFQGTCYRLGALQRIQAAIDFQDNEAMAQNNASVFGVVEQAKDLYDDDYKDNEENDISGTQKVPHYAYSHVFE
jgi:hypothetical protein